MFAHSKLARVALGLATLVAAASIAACAGDAWLDASNPAGNAFFDPRLAREIRAFWYVSDARIEAAARLLETQTVVTISREQAATLIDREPDVGAGESLYLIRSIDVADPAGVRIYQLGSWVQVNAATHSTCFVSRPPIRRRPVVVALPQAPTRLRLGYSCERA